MPTLAQGLSGNSVPFIGLMRSLRYLSQVAQFCTTFVITWLIPGHQTEETALARALVTPRIPRYSIPRVDVSRHLVLTSEV